MVNCKSLPGTGICCCEFIWGVPLGTGLFFFFYQFVLCVIHVFFITGQSVDGEKVPCVRTPLRTDITNFHHPSADKAIEVY